MDKFVEDAFKEAGSVEYNAFHSIIVDNDSELMDIVAKHVGMEKVERMSKAIVLTGNSETFSNFVCECIMMAFTAGWEGAKKQYL